MSPLLKAIAKYEGFGANPNNRPTRNNNPGDIEYGRFAWQHGALRMETVGAHQEPRFAVFPTAEAGFNALKILLQLHYSGMTVTQFVAKYAPSTENNCAAYVKYICDYCKCTPDTVIDTLLQEDVA